MYIVKRESQNPDIYLDGGVKVQRLWAYNSKTGGSYVFLTTTEAGKLFLSI
jgi:hypothetical protein